MDSIVVKVSDLLAKAKELSEANMKYVSLMTCDSYEDDGELVPARLSFTAITSKNSFDSVDFEDIELVDGIDI
ncbi:MAG TPA: hypothetical protein DDW34_09850 [Clostridium sp.]|nr:hypothetical protein [Clostridium sp.]